MNVLHDNMKLVCLDGATLYQVQPTLDARWETISALCDCTIWERTAPGELVERLKGAQMALTNKTVIDAAAIAQLPDLKYIGVLATGYNVVDTEAAKAAGITVTNIPAYSTASVAQHAIALLLAIVNRVETYASAVSRGEWTESLDFTFRIQDWHELTGKTFGVVGFGNTGQATAAIAAALGMRIAVYTSKNQSELPEGYVKVDLDTLFAESDVVSLHCPLTSETAGLVDARRLGMMKPTAILINTGRGPLVNARDLAEALVEGRIYAAGVDVLDNEPPHFDNPLLAAPRCYITPHIAWSSAEARERLLGIAVENIKAYLGGNPINIVS